jgi:hypothetical protein
MPTPIHRSVTITSKLVPPLAWILNDDCFDFDFGFGYSFFVIL